MTPKERVLRVINKPPDDATVDDVLYRLEFLRSIEQGAKEADLGLGIEHEEVFRQLLKDAGPSSQGRRFAR
jgi:hypothetical protein